MAGLNILYVKDRKGILKIVELIVTCVAFACMAVSNDGLVYRNSDSYKTRYDFFLAAHVIGFVVAIVIFLVHLMSMQDNLGSNKIWNYLNLVLCFVIAVLCATSAGLMIKFAENEHQSPFYRLDFGKWRWYADHRITAIAFGFFSAVAFLIDAFFQLLEIC